MFYFLKRRNSAQLKRRDHLIWSRNLYSSGGGVSSSSGSSGSGSGTGVSSSSSSSSSSCSSSSSSSSSSKSLYLHDRKVLQYWKSKVIVNKTRVIVILS